MDGIPKVRRYAKSEEGWGGGEGIVGERQQPLPYKGETRERNLGQGSNSCGFREGRISQDMSGIDTKVSHQPGRYGHRCGYLPSMCLEEERRRGGRGTR